MDLNSLIQNYKTAVLEKDLEAFAAIYDEDVLVFDIWQQWTYQGLNSWLGMVKDWFTSLGSEKDVVSFDYTDIKEFGDLGLITAIVKFTAVSERGEELRYLQNRLTWIAQKKMAPGRLFTSILLRR